MVRWTVVKGVQCTMLACARMSYRCGHAAGCSAAVAEPAEHQQASGKESWLCLSKLCLAAKTCQVHMEEIKLST